MNNLRTLGVGMQAYQAQFDGSLPWEGYAEGDRPGRHVGPWDDASQWFNAAPAYAGSTAYAKLQQADLAGGAALPRDGDAGLFICPESSPAVAGMKDDLVQDGYFMLWGQNAVGSVLDRRRTYWSYGFNTQLDAGVEDRHVGYRVYIHATKIPKPTETVLLVEKLMRPAEFTPPFTTSIGQGEVSWREFTTRHDGGGHLLFLDTHVAYFTRDELLNVTTAPDDFNQPGKAIWNPGGFAN